MVSTTIPPSLCGNFVTNKRSWIALTWTITCISTIISFIICSIYILQIHTSYIRLEHTYYDIWYTNYQQYVSNQQQQQEEGEEGGEQQQQQQQHSADREWSEFTFVYNTMRSGSITVMVFYLLMITTTLILYGSTAIIGFTSLRGIYIAPCFSSHDPATLSWKLGIFGGAIVFFANVLLICAVILGEVRVEDWQNNNQKDEHNDNEQNQNNNNNNNIPYEIERIATTLAVTCMFLAALYSIFAILLFLYFGSREHMVDDYTDTINIVHNNVTNHHLQMTTPQPNNTVTISNSMRRHTTQPGGGGMVSVGVDPRREKLYNNNDVNDMGGVGQYEMT